MSEADMSTSAPSVIPATTPVSDSLLSVGPPCRLLHPNVLRKKSLPGCPQGRYSRFARACLDVHLEAPPLLAEAQAWSKTTSWAPSQRAISPSGRRYSFPSITVRKWLPASCPALL